MQNNSPTIISNQSMTPTPSNTAIHNPRTSVTSTNSVSSNSSSNNSNNSNNKQSLSELYYQQLYSNNIQRTQIIPNISSNQPCIEIYLKKANHLFDHQQHVPNPYFIFACSNPINNNLQNHKHLQFERKVLKSHVIKHSNNPIYNELFLFDILLDNNNNSKNLDYTNKIVDKKITTILTLQCWNKHLIKNDELIGVKTIDLNKLYKNKNNNLNITLIGNFMGNVEISIFIHYFGLQNLDNIIYKINELNKKLETLPNIENKIIINKYKIIHFISNKLSKTGDYNILLYKVLDLKLNIFKILKKIKCDSINSANEALKESWPLKELQHPNIVSYDDLFIDIDNSDLYGTCFYICYITEYFENDCYKFLNKIKKKNLNLSLRRINNYLLQIIKGLNYLHLKNIIYRNLNLNNIYLDNENNNIIKIGDFHFSKSITLAGAGVTKMNCFSETMAPEICILNNFENNTLQNNLQNKYNYEVDIWSFGILIFEFLTLNMSLNHSILATFNYEHYLNDILIKEIKNIYKNDADKYIDLMKQCLQLDPMKRTTAQQLEEQLEQFNNVNQ
ncbi:hypothetical protein ABK040_002387 [Willaertia magna]